MSRKARERAIKALAQLPNLYNITHATGEAFRDHEDFLIYTLARAMEDTQSRDDAARHLYLLHERLSQRA